MRWIRGSPATAGRLHDLANGCAPMVHLRETVLRELHLTGDNTAGTPVTGRPCDVRFRDLALYFVRMFSVQAEQRPMTWAMPTFEPSTWRSPAWPRRCQTISAMFATPVAPSG